MIVNERWKKILGLLGWLVITGLVAAFGSQFESGPWYDALEKPSWTPPSWLFGPVWTVLYILMAVAAWLVWSKHRSEGAPLALGLYIVHLLFNGAWSWIFFGLEMPGLALLDIIVLWVMIVVLIVLFYRYRPMAGWLLIPYLLWVSYATALNLAIWSMNT